ncbi:MAG: Ig-like domain-containing protein [Paracoccaceae bacterium]
MKKSRIAASVLAYTVLLVLGFTTLAAAQSNLALSGTASASSVGFGTVANDAIDGNTSGSYSSGSVFHSSLGAQEWWQVDLGSVNQISIINLFNRTDCCAFRGVNYHVFVSDVPFTGTSVAASQAQAGVLDIFQAPQMGRPTTVAVNRSGRYVRVQTTGIGLAASQRYLQLAEVQVIGSPPAPEIDISSSEGGAIVDGGTDAHGVETAGVAKTVTYTVDNTGTSLLTIGGTPTVSILSNVNSPVTVGVPGSLSLAPGATTTFTITYTPTAAGPFSFDIDVASNDADEGNYDIEVSGTGNLAPTVVLTGPAGAQAGPFTVTATFSEPISGLTPSDFATMNGTASNLAMVSPLVYTILVTPMTPGTPVSVSLPANMVSDAASAMNTASNVLSFASGALTNAERDQVRDIIIEEEVRSLRRELAVNQRAVRGARDRMIAAQGCRDLEGDLENEQITGRELDAECGRDTLTRNTVPLSFSGSFEATQDLANITGSFFGQRGSFDGQRRRLVFGELDVTRYEDGGVTASLNGRVAWERLMSNDVLFGYFLGANASRSDIDSAFSGTRTGYGLSAGAYFVDELDDNLFWHGFLASGVGRNNLDLGNGRVDVGSDYTTTSIQMGLAVSGIKEYESFELRPELSLAYGYSRIGDVHLSVTTATSSLSEVISAGNVGLGTVSFTPEFIIPLDVNNGNYDESDFRIAPSLTCEYLKTTTTSRDCGGGLELEWSASSNDGLREFSVRISREAIGQSARDSIGLQFKSQF